MFFWMLLNLSCFPYELVHIPGFSDEDIGVVEHDMMGCCLFIVLLPNS
jgi:hypothetical protein